MIPRRRRKLLLALAAILCIVGGVPTIVAVVRKGTPKSHAELLAEASVPFVEVPLNELPALAMREAAGILRSAAIDPMDPTRYRTAIIHTNRLEPSGKMPQDLVQGDLVRLNLFSAGSLELRCVDDAYRHGSGGLGVYLDSPTSSADGFLSTSNDWGDLSGRIGAADGTSIVLQGLLNDPRYIVIYTMLHDPNAARESDLTNDVPTPEDKKRALERLIQRDRRARPTPSSGATGGYGHFPFR